MSRLPVTQRVRFAAIAASAAYGLTVVVWRRLGGRPYPSLLSCRGSRLVWLAAFTLLIVATRSFPQMPASPEIDANSGVEPWTGGTIDDALAQSASGSTIPMTSYDWVSPRPRGTQKGVLVGGTPFGANPNPVPIEAVLIPLIVQIIRPDGSILTQDPTAANPCDSGGFSPVFRFSFSPLVVPSNLTFNGVSVGNAQYIDGFMQAEFWHFPHSGYSNPIHWTFASAYVFPPLLFPKLKLGIVNLTGCDETIIISKAYFNSVMKGTVIPALQSAGVISPTKFAFFLMKNVVTSSTDPPTTSGIFQGQHYATGSPVQTWARASYGATRDILTASHEIGEWMNDPLITNPTPPWGFIGEFPKGCTSVLEVGDPTNGRGVPIKEHSSYNYGYNYHVQELTFFSWFFNSEFEPSLGTGGKFSSHGFFSGPSKPCSKSGGGTY